MGDVRKTFNPGTVEKIYDRLTVLMMKQELLLNEAYGPLSPEQKKVMAVLLGQSKDLAALMRELTGF